MPNCPSCKGSKAVDRGLIPVTPRQNLFGGIDSPVKMAPRKLFRCRDCDLQFAFPYIDESTLIKLYQGLPVSTWRQEEPLFIWEGIKKLVNIYSVNDVVLDVGCFCGDFLQSLGSSFRKLGIESSIAARKVALARNIELTGNTVDDISPEIKSLGCIIMLDVLEHIPKPMEVLAKLRSLLAPGASIILLTGATESWAWRLFGRHYWYSALPEHVSFFSLRWFKWAAKILGLRIEYSQYLSSRPEERSRWMSQFMHLSAYAFVQQLRESGIQDERLMKIPLLDKIALWKSTPLWKSAKDHILLVMKL